MIFAWISHRNTNDISIHVSAQYCVYSSSSFVFLAAGIPCLPCLAHAKGLCWLFTPKQHLSWTFFPQRIEYCFTRVSIPGTKGQGCLFLPLLFPCPGPHCCQSFAALPKSGSSSLEDQPAQSAAVPASFHWGFFLFLSRPFASVNAC